MGCHQTLTLAENSSPDGDQTSAVSRSVSSKQYTLNRVNTGSVILLLLLLLLNSFNWTSPDGITHNQIDHVLVDKRRKSSIIDVRSLRGTDCDTNHYLVANI